MDSSLERRRAYEERMSRIASVEHRMNALVQGHDGAAGLAQADPDGLLQDALKALMGLALHRPEFELDVVLPGQAGRGFRMSKHDGELELSLLPAEPDHQVPDDSRQVAAQLADLLRGG